MNKTYLIAGGGAVALVALLLLLSPDTPDTAMIDGTGAENEVTANEIEQETSDIGDASNAATDEAVAEVAEGNAPTNESVVAETREIAADEGVVGSEAFMAETYDREVVLSGIEESQLDDTVKTQLAADLDEAEGDDVALQSQLDVIAAALNGQ